MYAPVKGTFQFVRAERNQGISKPEKGSKPYDFATIRVKDEYDSFNLDINVLLEERFKRECQKGDFIEVTIEVGERFKNTTFQVVDFKKFQVPVKA